MDKLVVRHCLDVFLSSENVSTPSPLQYKVEAALNRRGYSVEREKLILCGFKHVDLVVTSKNGHSVGLEVDGPAHFIGGLKGAATGRLSANTRLRNLIVHRALKQLPPHSEMPPLPFSRYVTLSYLDWIACNGDDRREIQLLETLLSP